MSYQTVFKRYELKYMLTREQKRIVEDIMEPFMSIDKYGRTTIRNIYFDTDSYRLIRRSLEKPAYKEKLRVRSYKKAESDSTVFVELKKKYDGIVYKRRLDLSEKDAMAWLSGGIRCPVDTQISREIDYFLDYYETLRPAMFLSYEREAYYNRGGGDFRITFDDNILAREYDLSLGIEPYGESLLENDMVLMEIKCSGGIPLWLAKTLSREKIYKTSFSKYGTAYEKMILPNIAHNRSKNIPPNILQSVAENKFQTEIQTEIQTGLQIKLQSELQNEKEGISHVS